MKTMQISTMAMILAVAACAAGCGGGGGDGSAAPTSAGATTPVANNDPKVVDAMFIRSPSSRSLFAYGNASIGGGLSAFVQDATGLVTTLNGITLTGVTAANDVAGDVDFALGRWTGGDANFGITINGASHVNISGKVDDAVHYLVYNAPASFPAANTMQCGAGKYTAATLRHPSVYQGGDSGIAGIVSASGTLAGGSEGGKFDVDISVTAGGETGHISVAGVLPAPGATVEVYDSGDPNTGRARIGLGVKSGATDSAHLVAMHEVSMPSGRRYQGMFVLLCK